MDTARFYTRPHAQAAGIIVFTFLVRLWFVGAHQLDLVQDEAQYWDWTRTLQLSYYSKGPLIAWVIGFFTSIMGDTEFGVRLGAVFFSTATQVVIYLGLSRLFLRPRLGVWTLVVLNTTPLFLASGVLMTTDSPLLLCWVTALFSLFWAGRSERPVLPLVFLGAAMALGVLAKYMMLAFFGVAIVYLLGLSRHGLIRPKRAGVILAVMCAGAAVGFAPILAWNMGNGFVGFKHVGGLAGVGTGKPAPWIRFDRFPEFFAAQVGLMTPWWFIYLLVGGVTAWKVGMRKRTSPGVGESGKQGALSVEQACLLCAGFWPLWSFFILWSFHTKIYPNWPGMSYAAGVMLAAAAFERHAARLWERPWYKPPKLWATLGAVLFVLLFAQNWLPFPAHINPTMRLKGWSDLGRELDSLRKSAFQDPGKVFYFADTYDMTASLAFYGPGQKRAYCAYHDRRLNQYDLWPGPEDKIGWDAIYVDKKFKDHMPAPLEAMFDSVERIHFQSRHRGAPARKFTLYLCRNFTGPWPAAQWNTF